MTSLVLLVLPLFIGATTEPQGAPSTTAGDRMIAEYFRLETERLRREAQPAATTLESWNSQRPERLKQLRDMLGLEPPPARSPLHAVTTGTTEHPEFVVERLHFQSRPGLYVTADLYRPRQTPPEKLPAILYVCGHGAVRKNGVSYGNKVHYQHHGAWFARNGYVCLTIDTLQLGEIEGIHHGTYRENMWWWLNRGYTPAGVEAWNCIRALDYLETRPEVDASRMGVTGRSGGGAYSWWIAALDDRIRCAVPVAGITDLRNHVYDGQSDRFPDGCVEGHCDCMFMFNTFRWDYPQVAALVAPRPLMISNTDSDSIFPLDGVYRTFTSTRRVYSLYGSRENCAFNITPGGHADTQELRISAFHWLNHHLKHDDGPIRTVAEKFFEPEQLKVFTSLPDDQINTTIHETFVPAAPAPVRPASARDWHTQRDRLLQGLREKTFAGWPARISDADAVTAFEVTRSGLTLRAIDFTSQDAIRLRLHVLHRAGLGKPDLVVLNPVHEQGWDQFTKSLASVFAEQLNVPVAEESSEFQSTASMLNSFDWAFAWVAPRGIGPTRWDQSERKQTQHRRRFYLLGQSLDGMRVWDVRRAMQTLRADPKLQGVPLWLQGDGPMGIVAVYASLFEPPVARIDLHQTPTTHRHGPFLLNVRRIMDVPEAIALAAERAPVIMYDADAEAWAFPRSVADLLDKSGNFAIRSTDAPPAP